MPETTVSPYLTVPQVAHELGITKSGVYKLITRGRLPALKVSERGTRITRWALDAYVDRINGRGPDAGLPGETDPQEARVSFEHETGLAPEAWIDAWKRDDVEDTDANGRRLVRALALRQKPTSPGTSRGTGRLAAAVR